MVINNFDDDDSSTVSLSSNNDGMDFSELGSLSRNVLDDFLQDDDNDFFADEDDIDERTNLMAIFATCIGSSILEIDKCVAANFCLVAIIRHDWEEFQRMTSSEKINRTINTLGTTRCYQNTRCTKEESQTLLGLFLGNWMEYRMLSCYHFSYEETLLIELHYQSHDIAYHKTASTYGGGQTKFSYICACFSTFTHHKFYHRLCGISLKCWVPGVNTYSKAIRRDVCFDTEGNQEIYIPFNNVRPWPWLDCMQPWMYCLGASTVDKESDARENTSELQKAFYTHYSYAWGMQYKVMVLPCGMHASICFIRVANNDRGALKISGLEFFCRNNLILALLMEKAATSPRPTQMEHTSLQV